MAVTVRLVSLPRARAVQISATPCWVFERLTKVQGPRLPVPSRTESLESGPSMATKATRRSFACAVVRPGEASVPVPVPVTDFSMMIVAGAGPELSTATSTAAEVPVLPAASVASAVRVWAPLA